MELLHIYWEWDCMFLLLKNLKKNRYRELSYFGKGIMEKANRNR